jgi:hypothetical protein
MHKTNIEIVWIAFTLYICGSKDSFVFLLHWAEAKRTIKRDFYLVGHVSQHNRSVPNNLSAYIICHDSPKLRSVPLTSCRPFLLRMYHMALRGPYRTEEKVPSPQAGIKLHVQLQSV